MCTVSIVPRDDGFRLVSNRDERRSRPPAVPPRWRTVGGVTVAYPLDPQGGGTWLAASAHGLVVALINRGPSLPDRPRSRGEIPLMLIGTESLAAAHRGLARVDPAAYSGFLVIAVWRDQLLVGASDGDCLSTAGCRLARPVVFTSSSLGDADAEQARLPLFRSMVVSSGAGLAGQWAFHDHQWADRPEISVKMRRPDACTVSRTRIDVRADRVAMDYEPLIDVS